MADNGNTFPLVLAIREDGTIQSVMTSFEDQILAGTKRAAAGFESLRRKSNEFQSEIATAKLVDPLGLGAALKALNTSPLQKAMTEQAAASGALAEQQRRATLERVAAISREFDAAIQGIRSEQAARAAANADVLTQYRSTSSTVIALAQQQNAELSRLAAGPQRVAGISLDPSGIAQAAAASRAFANEQEAIASAAERSAASLAKASAADRGYAIAARDAANAASEEAARLEGQAAVHTRVAAQVDAAGLKLSQSGGMVAGSAGQQRIGYQQLGFQLNDVATQYASGAKASIIFAQQSGQVIQALQLIAGESKGVLGVLGGPWGIALTTAAVVLTPFVAKLFEGNDALGKQLKKLQDDARETEAARLAHIAFTRTIEGQIDAQRRLREELDKTILTQRQAQQQTLLAARASLADQQSSRGGLLRRIETEAENLYRLNQRINNPGAAEAEGGINGIAALAALAEKRIKDLQAQLGQLDASLAGSARAIAEAQQPLIQVEVEAGLDKKAAATLRYTKALGLLNIQLAVGAGRQQQVQAMRDEARSAPGSFVASAPISIAPTWPV